MDYFLIGLCAFFAANLSFLSGFGLGTLLMPVFSLFFPITIAVTLTAIVHFLNNLFKLVLVGKYCDKKVAIRFGLPAIPSAFLGAWLLGKFSNLQPLSQYQFFSHHFQITPVKLLVSILIIFFTILELIPPAENSSVDQKYLTFGGILSGFFGGISGHQGAFRSLFLIRSGLSKESFVATGVVIACLVDSARILIYATSNSMAFIRNQETVLLIAIGSAFAGSLLGKRWLKKITIRAIQNIVSVLLFGIAFSLAFGWI